jgi:hypothetical protein
MSFFCFKILQVKRSHILLKLNFKTGKRLINIKKNRMHEAAYQSYIHSMVEPDSVPHPRYNFNSLATHFYNQKQFKMTEQLINLHNDCLQLLERRKYLLNTVNTPERAALLKENMNKYLDNMEIMLSITDKPRV